MGNKTPRQRQRTRIRKELKRSGPPLSKADRQHKVRSAATARRKTRKTRSAFEREAAAQERATRSRAFFSKIRSFSKRRTAVPGTRGGARVR